MRPQEAALREGAAALGLQLTDRQSERLLAYGALILKWNKVYNLTALRDPQSVLTHHLLDSLAVIAPLNRVRPGAGKLIDVGAGAGLPGVVIAILRDDIDVSCLDAVAKKAAFVQQVAAELALPNLRGMHARVESLAGRYDIVSSRAFASLADFFNGSQQLVAPDGLWLAMKGKAPTDELAALAGGVDVFHVEQLTVPGLDAERCIVWARPKQPPAA
ncbi:16S rRNA (guanine(527)-N(7))-methyltransferase RsmG [Variovorax fucosicus]|uniref:16S rRNA (guanine(527)-N(7))-methyltransferase RsmG n=1 Tax=Variovorax fucosicus TaxID=3053517 RepID=UPI00257807F5|nr:16S rRNA (guanine(527)-N(7))-methyltransferase RsmG [Variovorax sp. J22G47]MDM0055156.1 16S rRNA (guanine(527)-N(7))-methyltransferase RsmG [Variovorax sp. J22G47]